MTERVTERLAFLRARSYRDTRGDSLPTLPLPPDECPDAALSARLFAAACDAEQPVFYGEDFFGFNRFQKRTVRGLGGFGNITVDFESYLAEGLSGVRARIEHRLPTADEKGRAFLQAGLACLQACEALAEKVRRAAAAQNRTALAGALARVPMQGARDYYEALVAHKFLTYVLRLNNTTHVTFGRFDQYMLPYYRRSLAAGATRDELLELTELFFIAQNFDTDLYPGVQQGDNGQSVMLGGCDRDGNNAYNELTELCLDASEELSLIDPKINLRVDKNTPLSVYERATKLTKRGLGFPQYSNDDVVIPALCRVGYDLADARDYTVAACWEFIVPGCAADVVNIGVMNYPAVVARTTEKFLASSPDFETFLSHTEDEMHAECDDIIAKVNAYQYHRKRGAQPFVSLFIRPCIERGRDVVDGGAKYNNLGIHGVGLSTAADALAAIRQTVFEEKSVSAKALYDALAADFEEQEDLRERLLSCPKMGNNDDRADALGGFLMDCFSKYLNNHPTEGGGRYRAGTGSAMEYIKSAEKIGTTADGRKAGTPYACAFSPSPDARVNGPLSVIQSFTKNNMTGLPNGGPLTMELHDTVFRNEQGEKKVAQLVQAFIACGGEQLQLNAINRDRLLRAKRDPASDRNLIVRVWGWSGYFCELDPCYQDHIIRRTEYVFN